MKNIQDLMEEVRREMLTSLNKIAMDLEHKMNQRIEPLNDEVKIISNAPMARFKR
jgi:hypothetical protein